MINKTVLRTSFIMGAVSGTCTLLLVILIYVASAARVLFEAFILLLGNLILYGLVGVIGGAIAGFILGIAGAWLGRLVKKEQGEKTGGLFGGILGGLIAGMTPVWMGFGYL